MDVDTSIERPHLTESWHKARRSYGLFSGLLLAWELVGISIDEAPLDNVKIRLTNPQAAPLVLIALVLYFALRSIIEWYQCDSQRRRSLPARLDWLLSHMLALAATGTFAIQRASTINVGGLLTRREAIGSESPWPLAIGVGPPFVLGWLFLRAVVMVVLGPAERPRGFVWLGVALAGAGVWVAYAWSIPGVPWWAGLIGFSFGVMSSRLYHERWISIIIYNFNRTAKD